MATFLWALAAATVRTTQTQIPPEESQMFTKTPNSVTKPWPWPLGIQPSPSPAIPFPARWDQRGLELRVRAN